MVERPLSFVLIDALAALHAQVMASRRPADKEITAFLRKQKRLSSGDRDFVAKTIYAMLRRRRRLEAVAAELPYKATSKTHVLLHLLGFTHLRPVDIPRPNDEIDAVMAALKRFRAKPAPEDPAEALGLAHSLPTWLAAAAIALCGEQEAEKLAASLRRPPPLTLRVNTLKATRAEARARLSKEGIRTTLTRYSPVGLTVAGHARVMKTRAFTNGLFEIQDEGSQLISLLMAAAPGQKIMDACAGAGGKTLHLAADMHNKGMLYAVDAYKHRLDQLRPRARRAGVHNLRIHALDAEGPARLKRLKRSLDAVLIDAPCSGTGALRRNPDDAWRIKRDEIARYNQTQGEILAFNARLVKPGGRLVYATCSLLPDENEQVVEAFLADHPDFTPLSAWTLLAEVSEEAPESPFEGRPWMRLMPHLHGTDGFFAAVMVRG